MKKPLLVTLLLLCSTFSFAQKAREFGLKFSNFDNYGIIFKTGKENSLTRFSLLSVTTSSTEQTQTNGNTIDTKNSGFSLNVGREFRSALSGKFRLVYGPEIGYTYQKTSLEQGDYQNDAVSNTGFVGCIFGFNYGLSENFLISAEIIPGVTYSKSKNTQSGPAVPTYTDERKNVNFGMFNNGASVTLAYRIFKKEQ
jgi:hypothetical protein